MTKIPMKAVLDDKLELAGKERKEDMLPPMAHIILANKTGKTSKIKQWLEEKNLSYVHFNASRRKVQTLKRKVNPMKAFPNDPVYSSTTLDEKVSYLFKPEEIAEMSKPGTILYIDNYDWANLETREQLLDLILHSKVVDPSVKSIDHKRELNDVRMIIVVTHLTLKDGIEEYTDIEQRIFDQHE